PRRWCRDRSRPPTTACAPPRARPPAPARPAQTTEELYRPPRRTALPCPAWGLTRAATPNGGGGPDLGGTLDPFLRPDRHGLGHPDLPTGPGTGRVVHPHPPTLIGSTPRTDEALLTAVQDNPIPV